MSPKTVNQLHQEVARLGQGVTPNEALSPLASELIIEAPARLRTAQAVEEFVSELHTLDRQKYSVAMYENALRDFQKSCRKTYVGEIGRKDI